MEQANQPENKLSLTRFFDAPVELVFDMWMNPVHIAKWWGPKGFTNPVCQWDAKLGKHIFVEMKGPGGIVYPMDGEFLEIIRLQKLVFITAALDEQGQRKFEALNTVLFSEENGKTKMELSVSVSKLRLGSDHHIAGMNDGWNQSIDRFDQYMMKDNHELTFIRTVNAPRDLVWDAWTKDEHLSKWYGPDGFSITTKKMNIETGGSWSCTMHGPDGRDYPNRIEYLKVIKPELLGYKHSGDEDTEPVSFHVNIIFEEQSSNQTRLTMHMVFPSTAELHRISRTYGAIEGANQTLARLENLLNQIQN